MLQGPGQEVVSVAAAHVLGPDRGHVATTHCQGGWETGSRSGWGWRAAHRGNIFPVSTSQSCIYQAKLASVNIFFGEGNGTPLQYSCLENPMDRGAWWAAVHGVAKSQTRLSNFTFTFRFHALEKEMATHSSVLAWRIPGTEEAGGLPSLGSHRVGHHWSDLAAATFSYLLQIIIMRRKIT